jgi:hypothetical protein
MLLNHLSTSTPASEVSSQGFRDDMGNSNELEASLDDILRNSPAAELLGLKQESLPEEDEGVPTPEDEGDEVPEEAPEDSDNDLEAEKDQENSEEEETVEDEQDSTQEADLPKEEDIDWGYKVPVTVDGKTEYLTLEEIRKGYATDKHLSQKGRDIGELKKQIEQEREEKLSELVNLGSVLHEELTASESTLAQKYQDLSTQIDKAKEDGDTYTVRELKEKREEVQVEYWQVRNKRETLIKGVAEKIEVKQREEQQKLLEKFSTDIKDVMPEFSEQVAKSIREFAVSEGIPEDLLATVFDARVVKFINDYRKLKEATRKGEVKRKAAPVAKSVPTKKGVSQETKQKQSDSDLRAKVLSGNATQAEQNEFIKRMSSVSKKF